VRFVYFFNKNKDPHLNEISIFFHVRSVKRLNEIGSSWWKNSFDISYFIRYWEDAKKNKFDNLPPSPQRHYSLFFKKKNNQILHMSMHTNDVYDVSV
jgi:hypothetical protein